MGRVEGVKVGRAKLKKKKNMQKEIFINLYILVFFKQT
jgi:hypothetical protein